MFRRLFWIILIVALSSIAAMGQGQTTHGYAVFSAGGCQHGYGVFGGAGGVEALVWKGILVGAEGGYQAFTDGWHFGYGALQSGYRFRARDRSYRWNPFVTYGMGILAASEGGAGLTANAGGGATYWLKERVGLRFEGKLQGFGGETVVVFRFGAAFR